VKLRHKGGDLLSYFGFGHLNLFPSSLFLENPWFSGQNFFHLIFRHIVFPRNFINDSVEPNDILKDYHISPFCFDGINKFS